MIMLGLLLCMISLFIIYKRASFILFGKNAKGIVIGYGNPVTGYKGVTAYPYKIAYKYDNEVYTAYSLENVAAAYGEYPDRNLKREVTVYFLKNKPELVTIKELNASMIFSILFLILGIISFIL